MDLETSSETEATLERSQTSDSSRVDRAAAFAAGAGGIPRRTVLIFFACLIVVGVGGVVADHFFSGAADDPTTATANGTFPPPLQTPATAPRDTTADSAPSEPAATGSDSAGAANASQLPASLSALMGLERVTPKPAPSISLTDQHGNVVSLAGLRGQVVVLTFFDAACDDICPVLTTELSQAYDDLGTYASRVAMLAINTDPLELTAAPDAQAASGAGLSSFTDWHFLTGSLSQLDAVWRSYGVTVEVQRSTGLVSHNDELYFIDTSGRLRLRATPFADESNSGVFSVPETTETAWATGVADQARAMLGGKP